MKNDLTLLTEKLKIKKFEWIPLFGTIIYVFRINMLKAKIETKSVRKSILLGFGKIQWPLMLLSIAFIITFFLIRNKNGNGGWPWPFFVAMSFGILQQLTPVIYKISIQQCIKKLVK
ncbi:MAG: hypothetical protein KAG04_01695 [Mycoplasmataceae bacterium]|nr:hypothetical protein [Mycoplasmataceae bacterium]